MYENFKLAFYFLDFLRNETNKINEITQDALKRFV